VGALFLLMAGPSRAAPRWLAFQCGKMLSRALMRRGGVKAVLLHLKQSGDGMAKNGKCFIERFC